MGTGVWCGHEQDITDFRRHQTYCLRTRFPPFLSDSEKTLLPTPWPTLAAAGAATLAHARAAVDAVVRSQESSKGRGISRNRRVFPASFQEADVFVIESQGR
jgi:hypothetical protein